MIEAVGQGACLEPMRAEHVDAVHRIERDVQDFPWTPGNFRDALEAGYDCSIWCEGGQIVGYGIVMPALDEVHLLAIGIARGRQREGRGRRLLAALMAQARARGAVRMLLEVRPTNVAARALYATTGFEAIGVRKDYYPAAHGREDALVLQVAL